LFTWGGETKAGNKKAGHWQGLVNGMTPQYRSGERYTDLREPFANPVASGNEWALPSRVLNDLNRGALGTVAKKLANETTENQTG
jgi:hypothetical protein